MSVVDGTALGIGNSGPVALGCPLIALVCLGFTWQGFNVAIEIPEKAIAELGD